MMATSFAIHGQRSAGQRPARDWLSDPDVLRAALVAAFDAGIRVFPKLSEHQVKMLLGDVQSRVLTKVAQDDEAAREQQPDEAEAK
jgi:hypothetical protein